MASSRKSSRSNPPLPIPPPLEGGGEKGGGGPGGAAQLQGIVAPGARLTVGLSGGVDSVVLLDCLKAASPRLRFRLSALHVNHQLSPNAARWAAFCRRLCRARGVPFESVTVRVGRGGGPEAAARAARYEVYARQDCDFVVLAHHQDDQVETLLLQLLRGAGVKGLAGMPLLRREEGRGSRVEGARFVTRHSTPDTRHSTLDTRHPTLDTRHPAILRPLLDSTREEILAYARTRRLKWIEDESNRDTRLRRNFLRNEVLPLVARRFPAYRATIARSAGHLAEAAALLDEVASADGEACIEAGTLSVAGLRRLPPAHARNLLRWFLAGHAVAMPATQRLEEALRQMIEAKQDARVAIELDGADLRRHDGRVYVVRTLQVPLQYSRRWLGEDSLDLPALGGVLVLKRGVGSGGISLARLQDGVVTVRARRGGERLRPDSRRPRRSLKNLLQEARVAPWLRERLPLIYCDDALVWAPGIGVDCVFGARRGEAALVPEWTPTRQP